jgi:hypothetical protein
LAPASEPSSPPASWQQGGPREFLNGDGEMAALIRVHEWASTKLGPPEDWPQGLKTAMRLMLSSQHPMFIWWGPELIQFYNDAYRRLMGPENHPSALGQGGAECWPQIWDIIGPQIDHVMGGRGATWHENQMIPLTRNGRTDQTYWTYSYGPIDEAGVAGGVGGVLAVCAETTKTVNAEMALRRSQARQEFRIALGDAFLACISASITRITIRSMATHSWSSASGGRRVRQAWWAGLG